MANPGHVVGVPVSSNSFGVDESAELRDSTGSSSRRDNLAQGFREHVTLGPGLLETVKGKLSLGARILQAGGIDRAFRHSFAPEKEEKLLKASQCYLSTTAGPIAGMLYISTSKIAFRSDNPVELTSCDGGNLRMPYKVAIPLSRVKKVTASENIDKPEQKYIQIATEDGFEFWFMGFVTFKKSFAYIQQALDAHQQ